MIKAILFDLDGTLLPMNQDHFLKLYLSSISETFSEHFPKQDFMNALLAATQKVLSNQGQQTNETVFWNHFPKMLNVDFTDYEDALKAYYENIFKIAKNATTPSAMVSTMIHNLKEKGYTLVVATNPVFPSVATHQRIQWAGLSPEDFALVTTYENSSYCKPQKEYYQEIADFLGLLPEECLMVGNDYKEDMVANNIGMDVFLLEDCLIADDNDDLSNLRKGSMSDLITYLSSFPRI